MQGKPLEGNVAIMIGMTKALAKEVQSDGIRVHAICPGGVDTHDRRN
jgi:NAD(P)-dependent dehydrogenase (short-subunit alcohol dehydrogenase family)